jgi:ATP-dependent Zn protease
MSDIGATCDDERMRTSARTNLLRPSCPLLSDLPGLGEARAWGEALAVDLLAYRSRRLRWADIDPGCLLTGPPGTGKTTFAKALAATCQVPIVSASFAHWQRSGEGHLGNTLKAMHDDFTAACRAAPCILFIDEIDSLPRRASGNRFDSYMTAVVNGLLQELDGVEGREGVIVIAACNHADNIDEAVLRAGRLDRTIQLSMPSVPELARIYRYHLGNDALGQSDLSSVAALSVGASAADVARCVREARRLARRAQRPLSTSDLMTCVMARAPRLDPRTRRRRAVYEAGRAAILLHMEMSSDITASMMSNRPQPLRIPCIGPTSTATRSEVEAAGIALLAGRAAEEVILGHASSCCGGGEESDLARVTHLFRTTLTQWGLSKGSPAWSSTSMSIHPAINEELNAMLSIAMDRARHLVCVNRLLIEGLACHLDKHCVLAHDQIAAIATHFYADTNGDSRSMSPQVRVWSN